MTDFHRSGSDSSTDEGMVDDGAQVRGADPSGDSRPLDIFLRLPEKEPPTKRLGWLARLLRLEYYPHSPLTEKVHAEITKLALILVVVFVFEFAAWASFFNGLWVGDFVHFQLVRRSAAVLFGFLIAGGVLYLEHQVITADTRRLSWWKRCLGQFMRLLLIGMSSFIVAHPIDLLAFQIPVERTLHAQAVDREEIRLREDLDRLIGGARVNQMEILMDELKQVRERVDSVQSSRAQAAGDKKRYREQVESLQSEAESRGETVGQAEERLAQVEGDFDQVAIRRAQSKLGTARSRSGRTDSGLRAARSNFVAAQETVRQKDRLIETLLADERKLLKDRSELFEDSKALERVNSVMEGRLGRWVAELRRYPLGDHTEESGRVRDAPAEEMLLWPEEWREPLKFVEPQTHFFEKVATVYQLAFGEPSATDEGSAGSLARLDSSEGRERTLSRVYRDSFIAIHLAAMFLPLLVFVVKWFLMPKEVDAYFSTWHQAIAGDPGARTALSVEDKVRKSGHRW